MPKDLLVSQLLLDPAWSISSINFDGRQSLVVTLTVKPAPDAQHLHILMRRETASNLIEILSNVLSEVELADKKFFLAMNTDFQQENQG